MIKHALRALSPLKQNSIVSGMLLISRSQRTKSLFFSRGVSLYSVVNNDNIKTMTLNLIYVFASTQYFKRVQ
jgi:hypothetical protein